MCNGFKALSLNWSQKATNVYIPNTCIKGYTYSRQASIGVRSNDKRAMFMFLSEYSILFMLTYKKKKQRRSFWRNGKKERKRKTQTHNDIFHWIIFISESQLSIRHFEVEENLHSYLLYCTHACIKFCKRCRIPNILYNDLIFSLCTAFFIH